VKAKTMGAGIFVSHALQRHGALLRSCDVRLVRFAEERARFQLDHAAQLELHPAQGDRLECSLFWGDDEFMTAVDVYAVHPGGFVDVHGVSPIHELDKPDRARLRRYPVIEKRAAK
jgi:hypothetical protein